MDSLKRYGILLFLLVILSFVHEEGHNLALRHYEVDVDSICIGLPIEGITFTLWEDNNGTEYNVSPLLLFGVTVSKEIDAFDNLQPLSKIIVYLSGGVFNLMLAFGLLLLYFLAKKSGLRRLPEVIRTIKLASFYSLLVGLTNWLVVLPALDGGRILMILSGPILGDKGYWLGAILGLLMITFIDKILYLPLKKIYKL
ncbi:MAG: M50 family metallopeptidase [Candidatus Paceibacterota bacterium]